MSGTNLRALRKQRAELEDKREKLKAEGRELIGKDGATDEDLAAAKAKKTEVEAVEAELKKLATKIELAEEFAESQRTAELPDTGERLSATYTSAVATPRAERDPKRGFASMGEFALAVRGAADAVRTGRSGVDERLAMVQRIDGPGGQLGAAAPTPLHQEGHSTDGYMVPPDYRREIWRPAFESDELLRLVNPQPTESNYVQFAADESTPWGSVGIKAYWTAEGAQQTGSKLATQGRNIPLHKVGVLVNCTDEVLADAALLSSRLSEDAPAAIGWTVAEAYVRGTGAGQPQGFEVCAAKLAVAKETNQKAATIVTENVLKAYSRLLAGPGARLVALANRDAMPQVASLRIGNEPTWTGQNKGLQEAPNGNLLGAPLHWSEHCQTLGTEGDFWFLNLAGYRVYIHSSGSKFDSSIHLYFDYGIQSFRWTMRVGGQSLLAAAVSPHKGSATKSYFVTIAERA